MNTRKNRLGPDERSWPMTITALLLALAIIAGMVMAWRHLEHDAFLILSIMLPAGFVVFLLLSAAISGRKSTVGRIFGEILELALLWWP